jgi:putative aldouronate transport system substrate-binding protein
MSLREKLFLMAVVLTVIVVAALIPTDPKSRERLTQPSPVDWDAVEDDPERTVALSWQGIISHAAGKPDSWIERNLEERFNLELEPIFMDGNAYAKRRPLMLCGGDIPDVMWSGDPLQVRANLRNGFIMEIPYEVILEHCPTYVKWLNTYGKEAWLYSQYRGKNYGLPTVNAGSNRPRISCWRMDWLRNVGIDRVPETVDEMHEALYRFRHNDPDGNGVQDTYGWSPVIYHWSLAFVEVFAAYGVLAFDLMERDGKVVWGGLLPETKEALRELRKWCQEDLLDPDFPLDSQGRQNEIAFVNGKVGYMHPVDHPFFYDETEPTSLINKTRAFTPSADPVPGPPLRDRAGNRRGRTWGGAAHILQFGRQLEQEPEKVIRVLKMMEAIASDEVLYMEARNGKRGLHWDYNPKTYVRADGRKKKEGIILLPPYDEEDRQRQNKAELLGGGCAFYFASSLEQVYDEKYMASADREWYERNKRMEWGMMNVLGKSDVVSSSGRYLGDLVNYQVTTFIEMVLGQRDIDEFDHFVSEWRRRGGDTILEEANEMYREMQDIYDMVGVDEEGE